MNYFIKLFLQILTVSVVLGACSNQYKADGLKESFDDLEASKSNEPTELQHERKVIKTGMLKFETQDARETRKEITRLVHVHQGYIGSDKVKDYKVQIEFQMEVRIPSKAFDDFLGDLSSTVEHIEKQDIVVKDVTNRYIDMKARLKSKKALEKRYLKLLERAQSVEDMLKIENQLEAVRSDIESMESRFKQLSKDIAFSRLDITFYETKRKGLDLGRSLAKSIVHGWHMLLEILVRLLAFWPLLLIVSIVLYVIIRFDKKQKAKKSSEKK